LRLLGVTVTRENGLITLTTADERTLKLKELTTVAEVDGRKFTVGASPREVDSELYLPLVSLAPYLDAQARYKPQERALSLLPLLHVGCTTNNDDGSVVVTVRSAAPLQYASGWLNDPPRVYFDFKAVALGNDDSLLTPNAVGVQRVRMSQFSTSPDVVRIVADCDMVRRVTPTVSEQGRLVTIVIGDEAPAGALTNPVPLPGAPADLPVRLFDAALDTLSPQQSRLTLAAAGAPQLVCSYDNAKCQLVLQLDNAVNAIPEERLKGFADRQIASVAVETPATGTGAKVILTFKRDTGYVIDSDNLGVRVLVGTFGIDDMLIVLDAGHGGHDSGAVGAKGTREKDINLDIINRTAKLLKAAGARVLLSRNDDTFIPLYDRPGLANGRQADIFISVHCNSSAKRNSAKGTQTYYRTPQSIQLASAMHHELLKSLELHDGGVRNGNFAVIRESRMPSVLLEIAFINNAKEEELLRTPAFRQKTAEAILNGVRRYAASATWKLRRADLTTIFADTTAPIVQTAAK
jgi:N-acetylmuramoyl-L-alanine amidase